MRLSESEYASLLARSGQPLPATVQEAQFQAQVVRLARELGYLCYFTHDSRHSPSGFMDLVLARHDRPIVYAWELKTRTGKVSIAQQVWLDALEDKVIEAGVYRPGDMAEIVAKLRGEQP